jgi:hypothetical protein
MCFNVSVGGEVPFTDYSASVSVGDIVVDTNYSEFSGAKQFQVLIIEG